MKLVIALIAVFILLVSGVASANNFGDFLKGEDDQRGLSLTTYIAKTVALNEKVDIRGVISRTTPIDNLRYGDYELKVGLEY